MIENALPEYFDEVQKYDKVTYLLKTMRRKGLIVNKGTTRKPVYYFVKDDIV